MSEHADLYVEKVRYSKDRSKIIWISVREDNEHKLSKPRNITRKSILGLVHDGKTLMTIFKNQEGKYRKGQRIALIQVQGSEFIRTDQHHLAVDQLESLPEY